MSGFSSRGVDAATKAGIGGVGGRVAFGCNGRALDAWAEPGIGGGGGRITLHDVCGGAVCGGTVCRVWTVGKAFTLTVGGRAWTVRPRPS